MGKVSPEEKSFRAEFESMSFRNGKVRIVLSGIEFEDFLKVGVLCGKDVLVKMDDSQGNLFEKKEEK